jgi:hypothetical protein
MWGPSAALAVSTISLIVTLGSRSDGRTPTPEREESPSEKPASSSRHVSLLDKLTWGSAQEPEIYE